MGEKSTLPITTYTAPPSHLHRQLKACLALCKWLEVQHKGGAHSSELPGGKGRVGCRTASRLWEINFPLPGRAQALKGPQGLGLPVVGCVQGPVKGPPQPVRTTAAVPAAGLAEPLGDVTERVARGQTRARAGSEFEQDDVVEPQTGREYRDRAVTLSTKRLGGWLLHEPQWAGLHRADAP